MIQFLDSLNMSVSYTLVGVFFVFCTIFGILFIRKFANARLIKEYHEITGVIFCNLGALYAVLLGFTIVSAQERFNNIKESTQHEVACLIDLYRDVDLFSVADQNNIKRSILEYVESIVVHEWGSKQADIETGKKLKNLLKAYYAVEITSSKQTIWYTASVDQLNKLTELRLSRVLGSQESIGLSLWTLLILGGVALIIFLCFFSAEKAGQHIVMASIFSLTIALSLFLIHCLDTAFTGEISIKSDSFKALLEMIRQDFIAM